MVCMLAGVAGVCPVRHGSTENPSGLDSSTSQHPMIAGALDPARSAQQKDSARLDGARESSSIPVACPDKLPKHQQTSSAPDGTTTWLYPSEKMFYDAMKRKARLTTSLTGLHHAPATCCNQCASLQGWQPDERDMSNVVRIHNIVNEQAWRHIMHWEQLHSHHCNAPKLKRFEGRPKDYSPRARILNAVGYKLPFDRHDWYVDRCGQEVRYVIDFYNAKGKGSACAMFLDVRPALDSPGAFIDRMR